MKALSVRQPWAFALLHLGKPIENRSHTHPRTKQPCMPPMCLYRGPLLLHASAGCTQRHFDDALDTMRAAGLLDAWKAVPVLRDLDRGGIVGVSTAVGHIEPDGKIRRGTSHVIDPNPGEDLRWWNGDYGLVLADRRPLPFIPFPGHLGLFDVPDELVRHHLEALQ